jgi:anti-sigma factor RsiW
MSDRQPDALDARMRRHFAGIDTAPGFEARLAARIAQASAVPTAVLRARVERGHALAAQRLRREARVNVAIAAAVGVAAIALVWRHGPLVARWLDGALAGSLDPGTLMPIALGALGLAVWLPLQRYLPR